MFVFVPEDNMAYTYSKCQLDALLEEKVREVKQGMAMVKVIKEDEEYIARTLKQPSEALDMSACRSRGGGC